MSIQLLEFKDQKSWLETLVQEFQLLVKKSQENQKCIVHIALSGGSTPKPFYERLNQEAWIWEGIRWWLGDERCVPVTDSASNEAMVRKTLGKNREKEFTLNFQTWHLHNEFSKAAEIFESELKKQIGDLPVFDLILLGLGTDGHTASLFPETLALKEKSRLAILNDVPQQNSQRLTLTFPVLNLAKEIWFLVQGAEKKAMVDRLLQRDSTIPSACIQGKKQKIYWVLT